MSDKSLLERLGRLGLPLLEAGEDFDVNKTLAEVVKSKNSRYLEGFPVLLANAAGRSDFSFPKVEQALKDRRSRDLLKKLLLLSLSLYQNEHLRFSWANDLRGHLSKPDEGRLKVFTNDLKNKEFFSFLGLRLNTQRLCELLKNYLRGESQEAADSQSKFEELSLEYALSQVFSPKQKELFRKKLNGELLTKTEREYFSRAVKKKVLALGNAELHRLARRLLA